MLAKTIKGVRVDGDKVIVTVSGGNDAARWLCGELLAMKDSEGVCGTPKGLTEQKANANFVRDIDLAEYYKVSRITIWRWVRIGHLPPPQKVGPNSTRFDFNEVKRYEASRAIDKRG